MGSNRGLQWTDVEERGLGVIVAVALILTSMFFFYAMSEMAEDAPYRVGIAFFKPISNPFYRLSRVNGQRKGNKSFAFTPENVVEVILVGPHNLKGLFERFKVVESG